MNLKFNWDLIFEHLKYNLTEELKRRAPAHDGELRNSIQVINNNNKLTVSAVYYAIYVNNGTMPHYPPINALKKWARDKLGDEKAAYALQKKIGRYGTKPQPFIDETIEQELVGFLVEALKQPGAITVN